MRVLVTGAAGGIGGGVARTLAAAGHDVMGIDRDAAGLAALSESVSTHTLDLRDGDAVEALLADREFDCVVSCVGGYEIASVEDTTVDSFRRQLDTNLTAVHTVVGAALPTIRARGGRIVVVGSMVGSTALPYHGAYSAAKAGLRGYVDALRREVEPRGATVAFVEPGPVPTGFNERAAAGVTERNADADPDGPYADAYRAFEGYAPAATDLETVVERVVVAATTDRPRAVYRVSRRARWLPRVAAVLPDRLFDRLIRAGLPGGVLGRLIDR
ncbi:SDR family NAD(P)-dependent oxidoreductase [Halorubrum kocurii]|uniref:Short chain dehydrogenase n=1 Tax=Halorubrum kocurii JCM 14978 TaxID=1230456 RepID=M0P616_9EURY|nr:SDR family NAD(P)-dependent oxidoreductase [Halorubrum kocurii]EMA65577.1 short chain dehydrogenase [Halorubrum kocurii JCM 14978]